MVRRYQNPRNAVCLLDFDSPTDNAPAQDSTLESMLKAFWARKWQNLASVLPKLTALV